ncbi:unnamed protein product [Vitrella brassicaformis CCMP3155]|uniref:Uncharacterized protein n=1 Tax=Vitrella brassicaformis (strain CCMP3155) TaxID=1169540 RepID=A0A0G4FVQ2_VITBC|nr:unnamed protein product [Vitrella brassicaformis CCMP3155]|eukprot:CEM18651.1 unnamed protein product [Vitrella brassicaformis CCMP3155]
MQARHGFERLDASFDHILQHIRTKGQVSDAALAHLAAFDDTRVRKALAIIDRDKITLFRSASGRTFALVQGTEREDVVYLVMRHFCTCPDQGGPVHRHQEQLVCKHEIAYALSEACGRPAPRNLSDVAFSDLLLHHLLTEIAPKGRMPDE